MHALLNANKLTLNMKKYHCCLPLNLTRVKQVATTKSLGITIDDKLSWNCHIEKLTKKIAFGIGAMKRVRHLVPAATLHPIYQALIQPHFDYCSTV